MSEPRVPWYVTAWRVPWWTAAQVLRCLLVAVAFCGWGRRTARDAWRASG
jgi:hypothetical protein